MVDGHLPNPLPPHEVEENHLPPTGEGLKRPHSPPLTTLTQPPSYASMAAPSPSLSTSPHHPCLVTNLRPIAVHDGKPSVNFKKSDKQAFIQEMNYVLIGKFSHGRPTLDAIKEFFVNMKFKGEFNISIFDPKHLFIELTLLEDRNKLWMKQVWFLSSLPMRVFKWDANFNPNIESSIRPVWVSFPGLPLYLFNEYGLASVANTIGTPIRFDSLNINRVKLGVAIVCVELDISKPRGHSVWVNFEDEEDPSLDEGFWQAVEYDFIPPFCVECSHIGHTQEACKRLAAANLKGKAKADAGFHPPKRFKDHNNTPKKGTEQPSGFGSDHSPKMLNIARKLELLQTSRPQKAAGAGPSKVPFPGRHHPVQPNLVSVANSFAVLEDQDGSIPVPQPLVGEVVPSHFEEGLGTIILPFKAPSQPVSPVLAQDFNLIYQSAFDLEMELIEKASGANSNA
ncbi:hypothetical protein LIER_43891 [Lithospermum erythrorhizon]|uniref:DUF4283 domain-containing protein n=1 Tax=Lithospermum erythrorhizon TaxID=34254 RepID=A0AAV3R740_LITER